MSRPTPERLEEIRALYGEQTIFHGVNELLAEIDALCQERDSLARAAGGAVDINMRWAARVRELEAALRDRTATIEACWMALQTIRTATNKMQTTSGEWENMLACLDAAIIESERALGPTRRDAP